MTEQYLLAKKHECPVCGENFTNSAVRTGKIRYVRSDTDLRPYYEPIDPLYYDVILCQRCGYAAISQVFKGIADRQAALVKSGITPKFRAREYPAVYSSADAIDRYKLALLNCVIKGGKKSEQAYLCLKIAWLYRDAGGGESELRFLRNALAGFLEAYSGEDFPFFGMDENTVTYIIGELNRRCGNYEDALRFISRVVTEKNVNPRLKERAVDIKGLIMADKERAAAPA